MKLVVTDKDGRALGTAEADGTEWVLIDCMFRNLTRFDIRITHPGEPPYSIQFEHAGITRTRGTVNCDESVRREDTMNIAPYAVKIELVHPQS